MHQLDRPTRPAASGLARFNDPTTLVCAAMALALVVLLMRIASIW